MTQYFGAWTFDSETQRLINRLSGQRLRQCGLSGEHSMIFEYQDSDIEARFVVHSSYEDYGLVWRIDHEETAALWRAKTNSDQAVLPFGVWRRIDSCALDGLFCWALLRAPVLTPQPRHIDVKSGWALGAWLPQLRRSCMVGWSFGFESHGDSLERPVQTLLDSVPHRWDFVAAPAAACADLADVEQLENGCFYLPADAALTGFEHSAPSLRRSDGRAVIFPAGLYCFPPTLSSWPAALYLYADEDVFFFIRTSMDNFHIASLSCFGLRRQDLCEPDQPSQLPREFFITVDNALTTKRRDQEEMGCVEGKLLVSELFRQKCLDIETTVPSSALADRLKLALTDAGLAWGESSCVLTRSPQRVGRTHYPYDWEEVRVSLSGGCCITGAYVGGLFNAGYTMEVRLAA